MRRFKILGGIVFLLFFTRTSAQIPAGYYDATYDVYGDDLKLALFNIIKNHSVIDYSNLWSYFPSTDADASNKVWDIYSDNPGGSDPYTYSFGSDQCGNYSGEGDCFNREHSFPKSWFNDASPMYSDLFHIYPTDGWVNGKRGNNPYGEVSSPTWTSQNGSKLGNCSYPGYSGVVFEPIDEYKGDFARTYFYMMVRYMNVTSGWSSDMMTGGDLSGWAENMLLDWSANDPVSQKEIDRNNEIYAVQNNRNPFIDEPAWITSIWGPMASITDNEAIDVNIWSFNNELTVQTNDVGKGELFLFDMLGKNILSQEINDVDTKIDLSIESGMYIVTYTCDKGRYSKQIVIN